MEPAVSGCRGSGHTGPRSPAGVVVPSWRGLVRQRRDGDPGGPGPGRAGPAGSRRLRAARLSVDRSRPRRLRRPGGRPAARAGRAPMPGDPAEFRHRRLPGSSRRPHGRAPGTDRRDGQRPLGPHPDVPPHPDERVQGGGERAGPRPDRRFPPAAQPARTPRERVALDRRLVGETREPVAPLQGHAAGLPHHGRPRCVPEEPSRGHGLRRTVRDRGRRASPAPRLARLESPARLPSDAGAGRGGPDSHDPAARPRPGVAAPPDRPAAALGLDRLADHGRLDATGGRRGIEAGRRPSTG